MIAPDNFSAEDYIDKNFEIQAQGLNVGELAVFLSDEVSSEDVEDRMKVVSVIGGPASGKTTLVHRAIDELGSRGIQANFISPDDYNIGTRQERWEQEQDDPLGLKDFIMLNENIRKIGAIRNGGDKVLVPQYDPATGLAIAAKIYTKQVGKTEVLFVEGDFDPVDIDDMSVFVDVPKEIRLQKRIQRDTVQRGQSDPEVVRNSFESRHIHQYIPITEPALKRVNLIFQYMSGLDDWEYSILRRK